MRRLLFILIIFQSACCLLLLPTSSNAQTTFQRTFGGADYDFGYTVQQTTDGGYIVVGHRGPINNYDIYLIKTDSNGDTLWTKTYGGTGDDRAWAVGQTTDGGYIVGGKTNSFGAGGYDAYLIKTDSLGDVLWTRTYGGSGSDHCQIVQQTTDGGYIMIGQTEGSGFGAGGADFYLIKTDANGDTLWTRTYGETFHDICRRGQQTDDGGYMMVGSTQNFGVSNNDFYVVKTDTNGNVMWAKTYGGAGSDNGFGGRQTDDGGYILTGRTNSCAGPGGFDLYVIKTDSLGDTLWTKTYGGAASDFGWTAQSTTDGGYIILGKTSSFGTGGPDVDFYLIKTDVNGDTLWTKRYGGTDWEAVQTRAIQQTSDSGFIIVGHTGSFGAGAYDVYLIKTDANGNSGCNETSTPTVVSNTTTVVGDVTTTITGSGAIVNSTATVVTSPPTIDSTLCRVIDSTITSNFIANNTIICEGDCINFTDLSTGLPTSWQWSFSGATPSSSTDQNPANICYNDTGAFDVQLIATNTGGSDTLVKTTYIQVDTCPLPSPTANFTASDTMICKDSCVNFTDLSTDTPSSWQWIFPGANPSSSTTQNPANICYNDTGVFDVQLIATNANGTDTLTIDSYIVVEKCDTPTLLLDSILFIPNAFTPNGDGDNDILYVRAKGIKTINLKIYNRWGEKVFESRQTALSGQTATEGWDGTYRGKPLNTAVFAWYAEVEFLDGDKVYRKGNVTLIR